MKVLLIPNLNKENARAVTYEIAERLSSLGADVIICDELKKNFKKLKAEFMQIDAAFNSCDIVLTIGGDGTILHTAKKCIEHDKPILGMNLGRMGFLATAEPDEPFKLEKLVSGEYTLERRLLLQVNAHAKKSFTHTALNDVVIFKTKMTQIIDIDVYCDDILVNKFRADGVVIATPTGSTAYSLSAGGPILDAKIQGIVVTPICAHSLHSPPMVFSAQRSLRVQVFQDAQVSCDGKAPKSILQNDFVQVFLSKKSISLICFNDATQFEAIDKKLKGR